MRRNKSRRSVQDRLLDIKLEMEQVKLAKLRGEHHSDGSRVETFLHYEDLPPLPPEDRERLALRHRHMMRKLYEYEKAKIDIEERDVNPNTHCPISGEAYDYSEIEAKYGPYDRPDKPPVTVTLRPSAQESS